MVLIKLAQSIEEELGPLLYATPLSMTKKNATSFYVCKYLKRNQGLCDRLVVETAFSALNSAWNHCYSNQIKE